MYDEFYSKDFLDFNICAFAVSDDKGKVYVSVGFNSNSDIFFNIRELPEFIEIMTDIGEVAIEKGYL